MMDKRRKHNWHNIQEFYDKGNSVRQCMNEFHFTSAAWMKAVNRGEIIPRKHGRPFDKLLVENSKCHRWHTKNRLIKAGILINKCYECNMPPLWNGKSLVMVLDHINGVNNDYRLDNLRLLCPNCNSQTDTFSGRNIRHK